MRLKYREDFYLDKENLGIMNNELEEFRNAVEFERHILADLQGTDLPEKIQDNLNKVTQIFHKDDSKLDKAINYVQENSTTRGFIEFRKYLENFPLEEMKKLYSYCNRNEVLSERQLQKYKKSIEIFEKDSRELEEKLINHSLEVGKEKIRKSRQTIQIEEKAVKKAYSLTKTYQKNRNTECAGVFRYESGSSKTYLDDFRGTNREEGEYEQGQVNYSDSFRDELENFQENKYVLMHSHPSMGGTELGLIAYRPSEQDLTFFRNHGLKIGIICPLLPDGFPGDVSISVISLTENGFSFAPINVVNSGKNVTDNYPSISLYNRLIYLMITAKSKRQTEDQAMNSLQYMLGEEIIKNLY